MAGWWWRCESNDSPGYNHPARSSIVQADPHAICLSMLLLLLLLLLLLRNAQWWTFRLQHLDHLQEFGLLLLLLLLCNSEKGSNVAVYIQHACEARMLLRDGRVTRNSLWSRRLIISSLFSFMFLFFFSRTGPPSCIFDILIPLAITAFRAKILNYFWYFFLIFGFCCSSLSSSPMWSHLLKSITKALRW